MSDIVDVLRQFAGTDPDAWPCSEAADLIEQQRAELTRYINHHTESVALLGQWIDVWEAAGRPGALGDSIAAATAARVRELVAIRNFAIVAKRALDGIE